MTRSEHRRRPVSPALRVARFGVFAVFLLAALTGNARALTTGLAIAFSRSYFATSRPCVACALGLLAVLTGYAIWLGGGTVAAWRMPLWSHLVPAAAFLGTYLLGPLPMKIDPTGTPADRAVAAMEKVAAKLEGTASPCGADAGALERQLEEAGPPTGYSSFGRAVAFRVVPVPDAAGPVLEPRAGDGPGTLYLACAKATRRFWLSAVVTDALPRGRPFLVRDGVGRVAVVAGAAAP